MYSMTMSGTCATHVLTKANPKAVWSRRLRCMQVSLCWWSVTCCVQACKQTQRNTQGTERAKCAHVGDTNNTSNSRKPLHKPRQLAGQSWRFDWATCSVRAIPIQEQREAQLLKSYFFTGHHDLQICRLKYLSCFKVCAMELFEVDLRATWCPLTSETVAHLCNFLRTERVLQD